MSTVSEPTGGCPCLYVEPCSSACTCANPLMSGGCQRCCAYGSIEQRQAKARQLSNTETPLLELITKAEIIFHNPEISWEDKFDVIFGMEIWQKVNEAGLDITRNWVDPDTSYEEDIKAYMAVLIEEKPRIEALV